MPCEFKGWVMMYLSKYADSKNVIIHYYDTLEQSDEQLLPLVVCPGLSETAEEYIDVLQAMLPRRCIVLSFRGRGKSDTPERGYNLDEHISDIESVVHHAGLKSIHLFGYSRGVAYALGFARKHKEQIKSLILGDYPPEHRAMPREWATDYINHYLITFNRIDNIRPQAVRGIQRESLHINLENRFEIPVLVARGMLQGSLITDEDIARYKTMCGNLSIKEYGQSGHDIKDAEKGAFYRDIVHFLLCVAIIN
jgi:pimeloyl-ACP methyl ester carboxylesterase